MCWCKGKPKGSNHGVPIWFGFQPICKKNCHVCRSYPRPLKNDAGKWPWHLFMQVLVPCDHTPPQNVKLPQRLDFSQPKSCKRPRLETWQLLSGSLSSPLGIGSFPLGAYFLWLPFKYLVEGGDPKKAGPALAEGDGRPGGAPSGGARAASPGGRGPEEHRAVAAAPKPGGTSRLSRFIWVCLLPLETNYLFFVGGGEGGGVE